MGHLFREDLKGSHAAHRVKFEQKSFRVFRDFVDLVEPIKNNLFR